MLNVLHLKGQYLMFGLQRVEVEDTYPDLCWGLDESGPLKAPWGINIMKKTKKVVPKAFGVRLEDCQPGVNNKVGVRSPFCLL